MCTQKTSKIRSSSVSSAVCTQTLTPKAPQSGSTGRLKWLLTRDYGQEESMRTKEEIIARCEAAAIPFAPVARPEDLFDDPQLNAGKGMHVVQLPTGATAKLPRLRSPRHQLDMGVRERADSQLRPR